VSSIWWNYKYWT